MSPDSFKWEFRLPHTSDKDKFYRVEPADLPQYNAKPLWLRAVACVAPGPKLQVHIGAAPADKISEINGSTVAEFPLIPLEKFFVPFLPFEAKEMELGMGPIPFLIDPRTDLNREEVSTNCPSSIDIKRGMVTFLKTAIKPTIRNKYTTWVKDVGQGNWVAREPEFVFPNPSDTDDAGHDDDDEDDSAGLNIANTT